MQRRLVVMGSLVGLMISGGQADEARRLGPEPPVTGLVAPSPTLAPVAGEAVGQPVVEPVDEPALDLLECLAEALAQQPELGVSREAIRKAAGQRQTANGALLPDLGFSYTEIWQQQTKIAFPGAAAPATIAPGNMRTFQLSSTWVVFAGGALRANQAIARIAQVAAEHQLQATVNQVIAQTVQAYLQLLRAEELKTVADRTVELARQQVTVAQVSYDAGAVPRVNVLAAEAALQNALQGQLQAANQINLAGAALNRAMGRSQLLPVRVQPLPRRLAEPPDLLESLQAAVVQRPELRAAQKVIDINKEAVKAARAGYWPTVSVQSSLQRQMGVGAFGSEDSFQVLGVFQLNLWDWQQTAGRVKAADADLRAQRLKLEQAMQDIELQVRRAVLTIAEARQRVEAAQAEVEAATAALDIEQVRYTAGEGTFLELLDARRTASAAAANLVGAYYDNALAEADWLAAVGGWVAGDPATLNLPQGQTMPRPGPMTGQGVEFDELLQRYNRPPAPDAGVAESGK